VSPRVTGLEEFKLTESSFRRLGRREVQAFVHLRSDDLTPAVLRLSPAQRRAYMTARAGRWADGLRRRYTGLSLPKEVGRRPGKGLRRWYRYPRSLSFRGPASELLAIAGSTTVRSVHVTKVAGYWRRRLRKSSLAWYCVRAQVVIRVEEARSGLQNIEDRFVLVRASSWEDAKERLRRQWREYATPYLNSEGQMVSWSFDKVIDVYDTGETEINPSGTEVYSRLSKRRMRPEYVWRPKTPLRRISTRAD